MMAAYVRANPQHAAKAYGEWIRLFAAMPTWDAARVEAERAANRLQAAVVTPPTPADAALLQWEARVVAAHDPVVVFDRANKRLVTERSLLVLRGAAAWTAKTAGIAGPDASFVDTARRGLRSRYASMTALAQEGFAHIAQETRWEQSYFSLQTPAKQQSACKIIRTGAAQNEGAPFGHQWYLATMTAVLVQNGTNMHANASALHAMAGAWETMMFSNMMGVQQRNMGCAMRGQTITVDGR